MITFITTVDRMDRASHLKKEDKEAPKTHILLLSCGPLNHRVIDKISVNSILLVYHERVLILGLKLQESTWFSIKTEAHTTQSSEFFFFFFWSWVWQGWRWWGWDGGGRWCHYSTVLVPWAALCNLIVQLWGIKSLGIIAAKASMRVSLQLPNVVEHFAKVGKLNFSPTVIKDVTTWLHMNETAVTCVKIRWSFSVVFVLAASK